METKTKNPAVVVLSSSCKRNSLLKNRRVAAAHVQSFNKISYEPTTTTTEFRCQLCFSSTCKYLTLRRVYCMTCFKTITRFHSYTYDVDKNESYCTKCASSAAKVAPAPVTTTTVKRINNTIKEEPTIQCTFCARTFHSVCAMASFRAKPGEDFMCPFCMQVFFEKYPDFEQEQLSKLKGISQLSIFLERFIGEEYDKSIQIREVLRSEEERMVFVYHFIDELPVLIFAVLVYYKSKSWLEDGTTTRLLCAQDMYISYIDSVNFFQPKHLRTPLYQKCLLGIMDFSRTFLNITKCFLWSCPLKPGDDYILNIHPEDQLFPDQERLNRWYFDLFSLGKRTKLIASYGNLNDYLKKNNITSVEKIPYFYGDNWTLYPREEAFTTIEKAKDEMLVCTFLPAAQQQLVFEKEPDLLIPFIKSRGEFWNNCMVNFLQFDEVRKAKHATAAILYYINCPSSSFYVYICSLCYRSIDANSTYYVFDDNNYHVCQTCMLFKETNPQVLRLAYGKEMDRYQHGDAHVCSTPSVNTCEYCKENGIAIHARSCKEGKACKTRMCVAHREVFLAQLAKYNSYLI